MALGSRFRGCESFNLGDLARAQHARPHGEEARAARRLEPWQQVRTRGHPSRRPRFARAPQDEVGVMKDSQALRCPRVTRRSARLALPCAGLEGWRPGPCSSLPCGTTSGRAPSRLARPEEAGRAPQADGGIKVLAARHSLARTFWLVYRVGTGFSPR